MLMMKSMTASEQLPTRREVSIDPPQFEGIGGGDELQVAYLNQVHELSMDCIKIVAADGTLVSMNRNGQKAMQVDDFASCQGADWFSFWQGDVRDSMLTAFERARSGQAAHFSGFCPTMKGEPRWWDVTLAPLASQGDAEPAPPLVVISRDITAEFLARQRLQELNGQLTEEVARQTESLRRERESLLQTNEELENIAYSLSHDLLTPVRHIQSFARLARNAEPDKRERFLEIVERSGEHLSGMIEGVLRFSRAGRSNLQRQTVNLASLMRDIQVEVNATAGERPLSWEVGDLPHVMGDPAQLQQVLRSLCRNAAKFTRHQPTPTIRVSAHRLPNEWEIRVQDNGVGFEPNYGHKLFRLFQRLHHQSEYPGSGSELATVRRIVDRHGGSVRAEGRPGHGATFSFSLPVDDSQMF